MAGVDDHRDAFAMDRIMRFGWNAETAAYVALALHPLDDSPTPPRAFEKAVRKRSRKFAREVRKLRVSRTLPLYCARRAFSDYRQIAVEHDVPHYVDRFMAFAQSAQVQWRPWRGRGARELSNPTPSRLDGHLETCGRAKGLPAPTDQP